MKCGELHHHPGEPSRAPHGARGLKYRHCGVSVLNGRSRPARGAWIEIILRISLKMSELVAPRTGRVD